MKLYSFQEEGVNKMCEFLRTGETHSVYNASEMGCGKTPMSIVAAERLNARKVLVLCPAVMRLVWKEEILRWMPNSCVEVWLNSYAPDVYSRGFIDWTICSYDLAHRVKVLPRLLKETYDLVIYDEAHHLKNRRAKRTRASLGNLFPRVRSHIFLSGTPFTTSVVDGYTVFGACAPKEFPSFLDFASRYSNQRITPWAIEYYGVKNEKELSRLIRSKFYLRYTKEEVLTELPPKRFQRITLPSKYAVVYRGRDEAARLLNEMEKVRQVIESGKTPVIPASLAEHRRLQGEAKVEVVSEFVQDLLDQNMTVVLFAWHKNVIKAFEEAFADYVPAVITGETPAGARQEAINRFQTGETLLFIGNILAGGIGITLTKSSTCVLAELSWSPADISQATDRLHRIGQKDSVNVYYFVVSNSLDETISNVVMSRAADFKAVLDNKGDI